MWKLVIGLRRRNTSLNEDAVLKKELGRLAKRSQRLTIKGLGGFLPTPLSQRSTQMAAAVGMFLLLSSAGSPVLLTVGLVLAAAVWFSEMVLSLVSSVESLSKHSTMSLSYVLLLGVGLGAVYANRDGELPAVVGLAMALFGASGWFITAQSAFLKVRPIKAANLKNLPSTRPRPADSAKLLLRSQWAAFAATGVLLCTMSSSVVAWVALVVSSVVALMSAVKMASSWRWAESVRWRTVRELRALKPVAMMPYGGSAAFHIPMWEEYVAELGVPYFIETLKESTVDKLAELSNAPIVCPADMTEKEINDVIPDSVTIAFYVHNAAENRGFLKNRKITSVWVHHGDGDKLASYRAKSAEYDYLFVAGQGAIDRYANHGVNIPREKFRIIGRPQTESIEVSDTLLRDIENPTVLYAPTWHGKKPIENYSSLEYGHEIVKSLLDHGAAIIFRPHPASKSSKKYRELIKDIQTILDKDAAQTGRQHIWGSAAEDLMSVADVANASDAMVSDVSGIVTDYMQSKKPYAMVTLQFGEEDFKQDFPTSRASYVITSEEGSLQRAVDQMFGPDPLSTARLEAREYYLGGFEGHQSAERFIAESQRLIRGDR